MKKKYTNNEVIQKIDNLKSLKDCDRFESNMLSLGYDEVELISYLLKKKIYLHKFAAEEKYNFEESEEMSQKFIDDFYIAFGAYEEFLRIKNKKNQQATYLRRSIKDNGLKNAVIISVSRKSLTEGYKVLIDAGLEEFTLENVVLKNKELFDEDLILFIKDKLNNN